MGFCQGFFSTNQRFFVLTLAVKHFVFPLVWAGFCKQNFTADFWLHCNFSVSFGQVKLSTAERLRAMIGGLNFPHFHYISL